MPVFIFMQTIDKLYNLYSHVWNEIKNWIQLTIKYISPFDAYKYNVITDSAKYWAAQNHLEHGSHKFSFKLRLLDV